MIPAPPTFNEEELQSCRSSRDFRPILFEWYKYVGMIYVTFANIEFDSPAIRDDLNPKHYGILIGLTNRIYRLILSNVALSHKGEFGESTSILDRCIFESCIKIQWLCNTDKPDRFDRFIASGLKTELELKEAVEKNISARNGKMLQIEKRMLQSIDDHLLEAGFDEEKIRKTKDLPDLASMVDSIGYQRLCYTVGQRIGSHHIHGTWIGLRSHYIEPTPKGTYVTIPKSPHHINQYTYISQIALRTLTTFADYAFKEDKEAADSCNELFNDIFDEIEKIATEADGNDMNPVDGI